MKTAVIGGTGLTKIGDLNIRKLQSVDTPFGKPSSSIVFGELEGKDVYFLARHGNPHLLAPHAINYLSLIHI